MVWRSAEQNGLRIRTVPVGREVNSGMPEYTAQLAIDELIRQGKDPATAKVAVLGLAFKNNTSDLRETPTLDMVRALAKTGAKISLYDPLADVGAVEQLFRIRPSDTLLDAVRDADCIAVLALHRQLHEIDFAALPVAESCVLLDGRAYYSKDKIAELRASGYIYRGIGRGSAIDRSHAIGPA
jgi:UDP-N-acetyl-D-mannosaminuronic acid dehydrogenase